MILIIQIIFNYPIPLRGIINENLFSINNIAYTMQSLYLYKR